MISFKLISDGIRKEFAEPLIKGESDIDAEYLFEVLSSFESLSEEDVECAVSFSHGCLLVRIFDMGRYSFVYPIAVCEAADEQTALDEIRAYSVKEEIPLIITDIPAEAAGNLFPIFRHVMLDGEDSECASYRATVLSELAMIDEIEPFCKDNFTLSMLEAEDSQDFARLCKDKSVNEFWGYDYRDDVGCDVHDDYFLNEAMSEYNRSTALTLAARLDGRFIGDAVFHSFDLQGGADVGFRLLPEYQGQGLGRVLVESITKYAATLGLVTLIARVKRENVKSVSLLRSVADSFVESDGILIFEINL